MFERNRVDSISDGVPVEIALADGDTIKGKLTVPPGKTVVDALNGTGAFIEFEPYGGERTFLAKAHLASIRPVGIPKGVNLQARLADANEFDPHRILGLSVGATRDQIRAAYFSLAKAYHPDRYATVELPQEVRDYLAAMARRINAAHAALEVPEKKRAARAEAVFTSPGH
jgi:hypothetical protein